MAEHLIKACRDGNFDIVKALSQQGVQVNVRNKYNDTPLHWSAYRGRRQITTYLLERGADVKAVNEYVLLLDAGMVYIRC